MTAAEFLAELRDFGFHIGDGLGDNCSGTDGAAEETAAAEIYRALTGETRKEREMNFYNEEEKQMWSSLVMTAFQQLRDTADAIEAADAVVVALQDRVRPPKGA